MTFVSITFQKIVTKPFKQGIKCLLKGSYKIIHVIGTMYEVFYPHKWEYECHIKQKNKFAKKTLNNSGPNIKLCGTANI